MLNPSNTGYDLSTTLEGKEFDQADTTVDALPGFMHHVDFDLGETLPPLEEVPTNELLRR